MTLPLPANYFNLPSLTAMERHTLAQLASIVCRDTIVNALSVQAAPIIQVVESPFTKRKARLSQATDCSTEADAVCAYTQLRASLDDIIAIFDIDTPKKMREYASAIETNIVDRQRLLTLAHQTAPHHAVTLNWAATACPFGMANRDACFLECQDEFSYADPEKPVQWRGFVRALHSVELDACPSLRASHDLVRASIVRSGHVFLETSEPGVLDCYLVKAVDLQGNVPRLANVAWLRRECAKILRLEESLQLARMQTQLLTHGLAHVRAYGDKSQRRVCAHCDRGFSFLSRRRHCELCAEAVCRRCCFKMPMVFRGHSTQVVVCQFCYNGRQHVQPLPHRHHGVTTKWLANSIQPGAASLSSLSEAAASPQNDGLDHVPYHVSILSIVDTLDLGSSFCSYLETAPMDPTSAFARTLKLEAASPPRRSLFV
ncbi:hypothetical protein SDRG_09994 [Saprolegnia diclina VS20]|uniref:FYVE-type domain-containing protein n=1 Tax=Saprolegnia diclina (strain VS20) TaxID=1156394 RepID=T0Q317_SAPDV|nr:hypothetical protein SDRG_09994 [Saprolegnia diclina VS20]EQC32244.1 hypothetical protein SDRG_09994 [Saprolegnia diclina VS20]|eukprot:XP_008614185.1 hypothetical protein SDRG_09994 [Saprolegnia diclina VS20]